MKLVIDTRNGISGDIVSAGLIGLGANPGRVTEAMASAGNMLGKARISHFCTGEVNRLDISISERTEHLHAGEARSSLEKALAECNIRETWAELGRKVLEVLIQAEGHVHSRNPNLGYHSHGNEAVLHEASDILLDIMGMAAGMQDLDIRAVEYLEYVNVGSGTVTFSHGTLEVPTPATRHILEAHNIPWKHSDTGMETATPTGASVLAGCGARRAMVEPAGTRTALAGGTRPLPPILFMLVPE